MYQNNILDEKKETATKLCEKLFNSWADNQNHEKGKQIKSTKNNAGNMRLARRS